MAYRPSAGPGRGALRNRGRRPTPRPQPTIGAGGPPPGLARRASPEPCPGDIPPPPGLRLAAEHGLTCVALPSISTGAYRYPIEQAARIAVETVREQLRGPTSLELVRFVCFSAADLEVYRRLLDEWAPLGPPRRTARDC